MIARTTLRNAASSARATPAYTYGFTQLKTTRYQERPWSNEGWQALNRKASVKQAMHGGWMMSQRVLPFNYDEYQWVCNKAIEFQPKLSKEDILMIIELGVEYKVRLEPFCHHIENQLFLRIHRDYELDMLDYEDSVTQELQQMIAQLEAKSIDFFSLLKEDEDEGEGEGEGEEQDHLLDQLDQLKQKIVIPLQQQQQQQPPADPSKEVLPQVSKQYFTVTKKQFTLSDLIQVADLLRQWNSSNLKLLQYLQQLLTIKLQGTEVEAPVALSYLSFLTFTCQSLFKEYQVNRRQYTARSVKRIYKYQYFYYQEHIRQLITSDLTASPEFLEALMKEYTAFPIKRRELKRKIGIYLSSQFKKMDLVGREDLTMAMINLAGKDHKMAKVYRGLLGLPEPIKPVKTVEEVKGMEEVEAKGTSQDESTPSLQESATNETGQK